MLIVYWRSKMTNKLLFALTLFSALGCWLMAGVFFAFSTFVMKALAWIKPEQGIAAMQSISAAVPSSLFGMTFLGAAAACAVLAVLSLFRWHKPGSGYLLAGSLLYLVGVILVTMIFNVPKNNALAAVDPASREGASLWADYVSSWTVWNHVRTVASLAAAALLTIAPVLNRLMALEK
jgi:uncharacterized membrane protein